MKRRAFVLSTTALAATGASAGVMDWYNGVKVGARLPAYDTQFLGASPSPDARLTLIDFWATWCAPCREEFPHLNLLQQRLAPEGLAVIGLTQEPVQVASEFLKKVTIEYPVGAAGEQPLQKQLGIKALPYAVLVNRARVIVWRGQASSLTPAQALQALQGAA